MSQTFPVSGNIEPLAFPYLLVDLHRHGATGSLKVTGAMHPKALYFRAGRILFGSSNDSRDQLGAILIDSGRLTREQLEDVNAKVGPGNPLAKVLSESGFVSQRELNEAARHKVERILADVLSWDRGTFEFEDGVLPKGSVDLKLSTERLLLAAVHRIGDRAFALRHVELSAVLEPVPGGDEVLTEIRADVWPLLERLDGRRTLKDAIALTRLDEFEAVKTACALLFLGVVRKSAAPVEQELDLAGEAQSAFGEAGAVPFAEPFPEPPSPPSPPADDDAPMYTVPLEPVRPRPNGFAFVEETAVPEPAADSELPVTFSMPAEPFPAVALPEAPDATVALPFPDEPSLQPEPHAAAEEPEPFAGEPSLQPEPYAAPEEPEPFPEATAVPEPEPFSEPLPSFGEAEPEPEDVATIIDPQLAAMPYADAPAPPSYEPPAYEPPPVYEPYPPTAFGVPEAEAEPIDTEAETLVPSSATPVTSGPPPAEPAAPASRPSREDLAALDALLGPGTPTPPETRPGDDKWEPQFRSTPASTPPAPRRPPVRVSPAPRGTSRLPILLTAVAAVVVTTIAAWYFFLRSPRPAIPVVEKRPVPVATARPQPPPATAAPTPLPAAPTPLPVPAAAPTAAPTMPPPVAAPPAVAARPGPSSPTATASPPSGDGRALLAQGSLAQAAQAFSSSLAAGARDRYSVQLLTACAPENVQKAVSAGGTELFILPVSVKGQACYRVCWGLFDGRPAAEAALPGLPAYFRQSGIRPRLSVIAELLP
jgi:hypothetical protein